MYKSKRKNYLIDKPFQLGFIFKYLFVILITVVFCFGLTALYYYYDNLFGDNKIKESVTITYGAPMYIEISERGDGRIEIFEKKAKRGCPIYNLDIKELTVYKDKDGTYKNLNRFLNDHNPSVYRNMTYESDEVIDLTDEEIKLLEVAIGPFKKQTQRFFIIVPPLLVTCLILMVIIAVYSLFFSHKMAGPVYRMRVSLDRMLAGDYDFKIRVRKNDFFRNIVEKIELLRMKQKGK